MKKRCFLKYCLLAAMIAALIMDVGLLVVIGTYDYQFFWLYLVLFVVFYCIGFYAVLHENYFVLYIFAVYILMSRGMDIALRTLDLVTMDLSVRKTDIIFDSEGDCCIFGEATEDLIMPNCCHNNPHLGDPVNEVCRKMGYGNYAHRCMQKRMRLLRHVKSMGSAALLVFYCLRAVLDVFILFFTLLLAYVLQHKH